MDIGHFAYPVITGISFRRQSGASIVCIIMTQYRVAPMITNANVRQALHGTQDFAQDPEYVKAVIWSYINVKQAHGRRDNEIGIKLSLLEAELPHFSDIISPIRRQFRDDLPSRSQITRARSNYSPSGPQSPRTPQLLRSASLAQPIPSASTPNRRSSTVRQPSFERPPAEAAGPREPTPPPPPYLQADPDPESTRILESRLAAEAEASGHMSPDHRPEPRRQRGSDPEDRIWEESELLEAQRRSIAEERERKELEDAIRLSQMDSDGAGPSTLEPPISDLARDTKTMFAPSPGLEDNGFRSPRRSMETSMEKMRPPSPVAPPTDPPILRSRPSLPTRPRRTIDVQVDDSMQHDTAKEILLSLILENCSINLSFFASKRHGPNLSSIEDLDDLFAGLGSRQGEPRDNANIVISDRELDIGGHVLNSKSTPDDIRDAI